MIKDEIRSILQSLLERTEAKQVSWTIYFEGSDAELDDYIVSFPNSSVNIFKNVDGSIRANILNGNGNIVAWISSDQNDTNFSLLGALFDSAKESATKIDETLEDLKRALAGSRK
jgi:hypothetical protein